MKKVTAIILLVLYGAASSGATIHFHYCMDKLRGINLLSSTKDRCDNCGMVKAKNACCKDVHKTFRTEKNHQGVTLSFVPPVFFNTPHEYVINNSSYPVQEKPAQIQSRPPPLLVSLFTLFGNYRI
ncbi:MAG: hypothetical protein JWN76_358 [Chitinophagaceae bacterium]|nr:hypothetical protein [Chitinophagaceae bacterium]